MAAFLDHIGLNVSNLDASISFYCDHLGFTEKKRFKASDSQDNLLGISGVNAEISFLQNGHTSLELKEYSNPPNVNIHESSSIHDIGLAHLCFQVQNVDKWYSDLSDTIHFISPPQHVASGAKITNLHDPDGNVIELIERNS
jgi:catechol 2,3-dioxygenase-like lactoylglutathione lyase family enzyme